MDMKACECTTSAMDLFVIPPTLNSVEHGSWVEYHPLATLSDTTPIEFVIKGTSDVYIDLANTFLQVQCKIVKPNGEDLVQEDDNLVAPENLFLHTLFSELNISLNGTLVTAATNTYSYRSYIETILNYGRDCKESQLALSMYYKDGKNLFPFSKTNNNAGLQARRSRAQRSKVIDMIGRLHADIFSQEKYLLNGVDLRLRLIRSKDSFALLAVAARDDIPTPTYKIKLLHASLFVRKITPNPAVLIAHSKALSISTAKYPVKRVVTKVFAIPQGNMNVVQDNMFLGTRPNRLIIALIDSRAYNGDYSRSCYEMKTHDITSLCVFSEGQMYPSKALKPSFDNDVYARSYFSLFAGTGILWKDQGNFISYDDFKNGFCLFCFDLSACMMNDYAVEIPKASNLRLEINFGKALVSPVHIIAYGESDGMIEIDQARQVITDFTS